jgi:hypothetical protein
MLRHLRRTRDAVIHSIALSLGCVTSYWLITHLLAQVVPASKDDDLLGGMRSVIATMFIYRHSYDQSIVAALSRMVATQSASSSVLPTCWSSRPAVGHGRASRNRGYRDVDDRAER